MSHPEKLTVRILIDTKDESRAFGVMVAGQEGYPRFTLLFYIVVTRQIIF